MELPVQQGAPGSRGFDRYWYEWARGFFKVGAEAAMVAEMGNLGPESRVLDLGCGRCRLIPALPPIAAYVGVDWDEEAMNTSSFESAPLTLICANTAAKLGEEVGLGDFDLALSWMGSLGEEAGKWDEGTVARAFDALKPGGRFLVTHIDPMQQAIGPQPTTVWDAEDGTRVIEDCRFEPATMQLGVTRTLLSSPTRGGVTVLGHSQRHQRLYTLKELVGMLRLAGFTMAGMETLGGFVMALGVKP